jgi:phosphate starvation-inducible PhoH-like protein
MAVTGDLTQIDLPAGQKCGLKDALAAIRGIAEIGIVEFSQADVVRHALVGKIVGAYDERDRRRSKRAKESQQPSRGADGSQD